jgi:hypothetical protein
MGRGHDSPLSTHDISLSTTFAVGRPSPVRCGYLPQPTEKHAKIVGLTFFYLGLDKVFFRYGE